MADKQHWCSLWLERCRTWTGFQRYHVSPRHGSPLDAWEKHRTIILIPLMKQTVKRNSQDYLLRHRILVWVLRVDLSRDHWYEILKACWRLNSARKDLASALASSWMSHLFTWNLRSVVTLSSKFRGLGMNRSASSSPKEKWSIRCEKFLALIDKTFKNMPRLLDTLNSWGLTWSIEQIGNVSVIAEEWYGPWDSNVVWGV